MPAASPSTAALPRISRIGFQALWATRPAAHAGRRRTTFSPASLASVQEQSHVLHEALSAVGAQSMYVLIAGAGHEGPEFVSPAITATVVGFLAEKLG